MTKIIKVHGKPVHQKTVYVEETKLIKETELVKKMEPVKVYY